MEDRSLLSAGFLNPHFGTGGKTLINFGSNTLTGSFANPSFVVNPGGSTLLAGVVTDANTGLFSIAVAELTKDGSLNPHFGTEGEAVINLGPNLSFNSLGTNIAVRPDGKIVLEGSVRGPGITFYMGVAELNNDGSLDPSFGNGGVTLIPVTGPVYPTNFVVAPEGNIVVAGSASGNGSTGAPPGVAVAELTKAGQLNSNFGVGGESFISGNIFGGNTNWALETPTNGLAPFNPVALLADGEIVLTGQTLDTTTFNLNGIGIVELTKYGSLNAGFGQRGKAFVDFGPNLGYVQFVNSVINEDGTILISANTYSLPNYAVGYFSVAELNKDGSLNLHFGVGGETNVDFGPNNFVWNLTNVAGQSNGTIVLGGTVSSTNNSPTGFGVAELTKDGHLKADFGVGGETTFDFGANYTTPNNASNFVVHPDGTIVVATTITNVTTGQNDFAVAELTKDGNLNPNFGNAGETVVDFGAGNPATLSYAIVQPDGAIILAGESTNSNTKQVSWAVAELTAPLPKVKVNSIANLEGVSGLTPFIFHVRLPYGGSANAPVTYDVYTTDGTAKAGVNYVDITAGDAAHGGTVTFAQGSNWATVTVYVIAGSLPVTQGMPTATFTINISDPANPGVPLASGMGTIIAQAAEAPMNIGSAANYPAAVIDFKKTEDGN